MCDCVGLAATSYCISFKRIVFDSAGVRRLKLIGGKLAPAVRSVGAVLCICTRQCQVSEVNVVPGIRSQCGHNLLKHAFCSRYAVRRQLTFVGMKGHRALPYQSESPFQLCYGGPCPALLPRTARAMLQLRSLYQIQAPFVKLKHAQLVLAHSTRSNKYVPPLANPISEQRVIGLAEDRNQTYQTSRNDFLESAQEALILKDAKSFRRPWDDVEHPLPFWDLSEQELEALTSSQLEVLATSKEMQSLLPDMTTKWHRLPPDVFQAITKDPEATAAKLVQLKAWFPQANISLAVSCRPAILVDEEFAAIPALVELLRQKYDALKSVKDAQAHLNTGVLIGNYARWLETEDAPAQIKKNRPLLFFIIQKRLLETQKTLATLELI